MYDKYVHYVSQWNEGSSWTEMIMWMNMEFDWDVRLIQIEIILFEMI